MRKFFFLCTVFNVLLDIHGVLEGESVVGESIWGIPNLWRDEKFFAVPDSTKLAYDFSLWPIITTNPTAKRTTKDRKDLVCKALGSGDGDLRIYVGKLPPSWTIRKKVCHDMLSSRISCVSHS